MRLHLLILAALLALAGCSREFKMGAAVQDYAAPAERAKSDSRFMAYEHSIQLELTEDRVQPVYEAAQAACKDAAAEQCTMLESRLDTGRYASATLRFRAKPAGLRKILAVLTAQGGVVNQSTTAEDLAQPISDNARKLEMLRDYRAKLEALRGRASRDIESLIKVNKELAQVQSDIEALAGQQAHLVQRVETEILNVSLGSAHSRGFWSPVWQALTGFGSNLAEGLSSAITAVAFILPWLPILYLLVWGVRKLWGRMKRKGA